MDDEKSHLTHELLARARHLGRGERELVDFLLAHVAARCDDCNRVLGEAEGRHLTMASPPPTDGGIAELLRLDPVERRLRLREDAGRLASEELAHQLIEEARECVWRDPWESCELARLALEVTSLLAARGAAGRRLQELAARAHGRCGNAVRLQGDLRRAEEAMAQAWQAAGDGVRPAVRGELLHLTAILRKDQRRLDEARPLLDEALALYRGLDRPEEIGRVLLSQASVLRVMGEAETALARVREACAVLGTTADPRLELTVRHNLAEYLTFLGRFEEAQDQLRRAQGLYERFPEHTPRRLWLEAKVAAGLGDVRGAEEILVAVREMFLERDCGYDAALVCLDLAVLHLEEGRLGEVENLVAAMVPVFRAQDVHREVLAALILLEQAVAARTASAEMVRGLLRYLEDSRTGTALGFAPGG